MSNHYKLILACLLLLSACQATKYSFSKQDVRGAQKLYGLELTDNNIDTLYAYLDRNKTGYDSLRSYGLAVDVMPAILFDPIPSQFHWPTGDNCLYTPTLTNKKKPDDIRLYDIMV